MAECAFDGFVLVGPRDCDTVLSISRESDSVLFMLECYLVATEAWARFGGDDESPTRA